MALKQIQRGRKSKKSKNKNSISKVKMKNKVVNKLKKKGLFNIEGKLQRKKIREKRKRVAQANHIREMKNRELNKEPEKEITGEEMMEMMDEDDLQALKERHNKDKKKSSKSSTLNNEEDSTEKPKKKVKKGAIIKPLLPVLTEDGDWQYREEAVPVLSKSLTMNDYKRTENDEVEENKDSDSGISGEEDNEELGDISSEEDEPKNETGNEKSVAQIWAEQKRDIHNKKVQMACLAMNVIQKPNQISNLRALIKMMKIHKPTSDVTVRRYVTMTLLQVFHDQIPGYRMRDNKPNQRLKKETIAAVSQEIDFLTCYRVYLRNLEDVLEQWKSDPTNLGLQTLSETSLFCLGDLVSLHPHFNYSVNIVQALVPYLTHKSPKMRTIACDALSKTMKVDMHSYLALEMVRRIFRLAQRLRYRVRSELLRVLFALPLKTMSNPDSVQEKHHVNEKALTHREKLIKKLNDKSHLKPSRKQKKDNKKVAKIRAQMAEINTNAALNAENKRNSEILQKVFGIYFHILKRKPNSTVMPDVLEGLAIFAHLINIEYFSDILAVMNVFLEQKTLRKRESLHCIQTVFTILSGQGESINIDPQKFYNEFYRLLLDLRPREICQNLDIILEIVEQMLIMRRKKVSAAKVISFTKRMATVSLTLPHQAALPLLISMKKLFTAFSLVETLLETDSEGTSGVFLPEIADPEHSNAASSAIWELVLAQKFYHPHIQVLAKSILSGIPAVEVREVHNLTKIPTRKLLQDLEITRLKFSPSIPKPDAHLTKKKNLKKQVFQESSLVLDDIKLQSAIDRVLSVEDDEEDEPPKKKLKRSSQMLETLDFCTSFEPGEAQLNPVDEVESTAKPQGGTVLGNKDKINETQNFLSYFLGTN